jgi:EpsD family peptidyl-prolyl cis-trans isomerase
MPRTRAWLVAPMALTLIMAGCGAKKEDASTQIAAKVNKEEISIHQINYLLQRQTGLKSDQIDSVAKNTLNALIDQELAVQAATELRIDRDPAVLMAIEAARREIVARAYADRLAEAAHAPETAEVKKYYANHPALFAQRRLYTLIDTAIDAKFSDVEPLQPTLQAARNQAEIAALLRNAKLRFGTRQVTMGAEELPMESVDRMAGLRDGQSHFILGPTGSRIFTVVSAQPAPLSEAEARPVIERFLILESKRHLVEEQLRSLRNVAQIEYRGKFSQTTTEADASATSTPHNVLGETAYSEPTDAGTKDGATKASRPKVAASKAGPDTVALRKGSVNLK